MAPSAQSSLSATISLTDQLSGTLGVDGFTRYASTHGTIEGTGAEAEQRTVRLIEASMHNPQPGNTEPAIASVEFIRRNDPHGIPVIRGALLFDRQEQLYGHIAEAVLVGEPAQSDLAQTLLTTLGVPFGLILAAARQADSRTFFTAIFRRGEGLDWEAILPADRERRG